MKTPLGRLQKSSPARSEDHMSSASGFRRQLFNVGDALFLVLVGGLSAGAMRVAHDLDVNMLLSMVVGMGLAMFLQTILALAVAPVLGSIEAMVPSAVVAMLAPVAVCVFELGGHPMALRSSLGFGALAGIAVFALLQRYQSSCRKALEVIAREG